MCCVADRVVDRTRLCLCRFVHVLSENGIPGFVMYVCNVHMVCDRDVHNIMYVPGTCSDECTSHVLIVNIYQVLIRTR